ncbi:hypothetical protein GCM10011351_12930 [Paraliobacillus quinghaiensis]|uniref:Regulatory protein YycH domain-containing protein n=1 Tax=Paraliobacillus quinghaiensis TaxID=470815 RepID=A0A917WTY0_9BACI|nr:two-component system activity regulator YycH [Paraliobacillus quinghaiensis]GGM28404.1 hypothetical protein GCM10011351_12930 [Paraliobacillus quinghaiensis]
MSFENWKTFILSVLIILSLLLTLSIWNYQPDFDPASPDESVIDAQLDGVQLTKKDTAQPSRVLYHMNDEPQGLVDKSEQDTLYNEILDFSLYDFQRVINLDKEINQQNQNLVEIIFPAEFPTELIADMFTVNDDMLIPNGSFDRIYILLSGDNQDNQIIFERSNTGTAIGAHVQNLNEAVDKLNTYYDNHTFMPYYVLENHLGNSIYLPSEVNVGAQQFSYLQLDIYSFRNLLFNTPSTVKSSFMTGGTTVYTDGVRRMTRDKYSIDFTNPTNESKTIEEEIEDYQLLNQVHNYINAHNGFTFSEPFQYFLSDLSTTANSNLVKYTLMYKGYPIYSSEVISTISVNWHNQNIYQYTHPLIQLHDYRGPGQVTNSLPTPELVLNTLRGESYQDTVVYDVSIGYKVEEQTGGQGQVYELIPTWYIKGVSGWQELRLPDKKVGGVDRAMGTN